MDSLPNFPTHGAPLAPFARESSAKNLPNYVVYSENQIWSGFSSALRGAIFQTFARKTEMESQTRPISLTMICHFINLVPRALFLGFGGGAGKAAGKAAPPPKPGKSALGRRLMKWQIIVRLMMVFRFLCKTKCKKVNRAEQIAMKRWKISHELQEF